MDEAKVDVVEAVHLNSAVVTAPAKECGDCGRVGTGERCGTCGTLK